MSTISVDLGSGPVPKNPFNADTAYGVDITSFPENNLVVQSDLAHDDFPFNDSSVDYVVCTDFLEHIPRSGYRYHHGSTFSSEGLKPFSPFIHVMSEVHRILKPGGIFQAKTPAFPHAEAFQDPTHVNIITEKTVMYFCHAGMLELGQQYGFKGEFNLLDQYWDDNTNYWLVWELQAIK